MEQVTSRLVLVHLHQGWRVDMQAHRRLGSAVADLVHVPRTKGPQRTRDQLPAPGMIRGGP